MNASTAAADAASEPRRKSPTERLHELAMTIAERRPTAAEHAIEVTTTTIRPAGEKAYRVHNWTVTIRGDDPDEIDRVAKRIDDGLAAKYASELDRDTLAGDLARSVTQ